MGEKCLLRHPALATFFLRASLCMHHRCSSRTLADVRCGVTPPAGIVHRDLKLENMIMLNERDDSPVKIADFGLSKFFSSDQARLLPLLCASRSIPLPIRVHDSESSFVAVHRWPPDQLALGINRAREAVLHGREVNNNSSSIMPMTPFLKPVTVWRRCCPPCAAARSTWRPRCWAWATACRSTALRWTCGRWASSCSSCCPDTRPLVRRGSHALLSRM